MGVGTETRQLPYPSGLRTQEIIFLNVHLCTRRTVCAFIVVYNMHTLVSHGKTSFANAELKTIFQGNLPKISVVS